jgi:hypothetical protein
MTNVRRFWLPTGATSWERYREGELPDRCVEFASLAARFQLGNSKT